MKIEIYEPKCIHEVGVLAEKQENGLWPMQNKESEEDRLFIVCDCKGDDGSGNAISKKFCHDMGQWFDDNAKPNEPISEVLLSKALNIAYDKLKEEGNCRDNNMKFSMALLYIHRDGVTVAHVGNCPIYHARKKKKSLLGFFGKKYDVLYQSTDQQRVLFDKADSIEAEVKLITDIQANDVFALCNAGMLDVDDTVEETFISCMMRSRTTLKGGESYMEYFKREVAKVLCHYNHSAWIIHVKDVLN
jgi:serine/threonine protein phosphatase PrpC